MPTDKKIVLLAGKGPSTNILFHELGKHFTLTAVILEDAVDRKTFIQKRIKKLGWWTVAGQILFNFTVAKWLAFVSKKRVQDILQEHKLQNQPIEYNSLHLVRSVNDEACLQLLKKLNPDIVVVNGTRIISKKVLNSINAFFINTHAGITPRYRGVHGAWWALANRDPEHCGVTVHQVDAGIDTGSIIAQELIHPTSKDNFYTYPYLQLAAGIPLLIAAVKQLTIRNLHQEPALGPSHLWYHPTLWQYIRYRLKGIR